MQRVVIDSNVLISAFLSKSGNPASVLRDVVDNKIALVATEQIFIEIERALEKPYFASRSNVTIRPSRSSGALK